MKFILTIYICSVMGNNCLHIPTEMHAYQTVRDSFDSCIKDGLGESFEIFFNGKLLKIDQINKTRMYPKFVCEPFTPEEAEPI